MGESNRRHRRPPSRRAIALATLIFAAVGLPPQPAAAAAGQVSLLAGGPGHGPATELSIVPSSVVAWEGRIAVGELDTGTVRAIDPETGEVEVIAGAGVSVTALGPVPHAPGTPFAGIRGLAVTPAGSLVFSDACGIVEVEPGDLAASRIAGDCSSTAIAPVAGAPATEDRILGIGPVAVDAAGRVYFGHNNDLWRFDPSAASLLERLSQLPDGSEAQQAGLADGIALSAAWIRNITGLSIDPTTGDLLLSEDQPSHRVRRVIAGAGAAIDGDDPVVTVAGTGTAGGAGDGGPANEAELNRPGGVLALADGRVVIGDRLSRAVRLVDGDGEIATIVTGAEANEASGRPLTAANANLFRPLGSAQIGDLLYVADGRIPGLPGSLAQVLEVDLGADPPTVGRVAGNGGERFYGEGVDARDAQLFAPSAVAVASDGAALIADRRNNRLRRVDAASGEITTIAGNGAECGFPGFCGEGGPATAAQLTPEAVAVSSRGEIYVADTGEGFPRIVRIDASGELSVLTGSADFDFFSGGHVDGPFAEAMFSNRVGALALSPDERTLYVADRGNSVVRALDLDAEEVSTVAGTPGFSDWQAGDEGAPAGSVQIDPAGVIATAAGHLLVADSENGAVRRIESGGSAADPALPITTYIGGEHADPEGHVDAGEAYSLAAAPLAHPHALAEGPDGRVAISDNAKLWLADPGRDEVVRVHGLGSGRGYNGDSGPALERALLAPEAVTFAGDGAILVVDRAAGRVRRVEPPPLASPPPLRIAALAAPRAVPARALRRALRIRVRPSAPAAIAARLVVAPRARKRLGVPSRVLARARARSRGGAVRLRLRPGARVRRALPTWRLARPVRAKLVVALSSDGERVRARRAVRLR